MARRDDLAKGFAERLDKAPPRGRAMSEGGDGPRTLASQRAKPGGGSTPTEQKRTANKRTASESAATKPPASHQASSPAHSHTSRTRRSRRGAAGTVLRGQLVPDSIHAEARRRKAVLRSARAGRVTWNDVFAEGVALLVGRRVELEATLDELLSDDHLVMRRRFIQASLPDDLDQELVEVQLDLSEDSDRAATYEQLWTAALLLWLRATAQQT